MEASDVAEIKRHFNVVAEGLEKKIQLVAKSVALLDEKVDRRITAFEEKMERGFDEVKAMLRGARSSGQFAGSRPGQAGIAGSESRGSLIVGRKITWIVAIELTLGRTGKLEIREWSDSPLRS